MLTGLLQIIIRQQERSHGVSLDYLRGVARRSPALFLKLGLLGPVGRHRRMLPAPALHVAVVRAVLAEDCASCVQIAVNRARAAGVPGDVLHAIVHDDLGALPVELAEVCRFADSVRPGNAEDERQRTRIRQLFGEEGLQELSLAIASAAFYPRFKRALGHAQTCAARPPVLP